MLVKCGMRIDRVHNKDPRGMRWPRKKLVFLKARAQTHKCVRNITLSPVMSRASPLSATQNSSIPTVSPLPSPFLFLVLAYVKLFRKQSFLRPAYEGEKRPTFYESPRAKIRCNNTNQSIKHFIYNRGSLENIDSIGNVGSYRAATKAAPKTAQTNVFPFPSSILRSFAKVEILSATACRSYRLG